MNTAAAGTILSQSPESGAVLDYGGIIQVVVSGGEVTVADYRGQQYETIKPGIERAKLVPKVMQEEVEVADPSQGGRIAAQTPKAGDKVMEGTQLQLILYVYKAPESKSP